MSSAFSTVAHPLLVPRPLLARVSQPAVGAGAAFPQNSPKYAPRVKDRLLHCFYLFPRLETVMCDRTSQLISDFVQLERLRGPSVTHGVLFLMRSVCDTSIMEVPLRLFSSESDLLPSLLISRLPLPLI